MKRHIVSGLTAVAAMLLLTACMGSGVRTETEPVVREVRLLVPEAD